MKKALITWITGQDGSYLADFLLKKWYEVHGIKRRSSLFNTGRIDHLYQEPHISSRRLFLHYWDLTDGSGLTRLIAEIQPDEIYNLWAQSHVKVSFEIPEYTTDVDAIGTLRILEAIRNLWLAQKTKFYQASSSELYGLVQTVPQNEKTPFYPRSPYAVAKLYAYWITVNYREAYNMFACNGILFNHESSVRWGTFVTRKITRAITKISQWLQGKLYLGNLDACRDWWHAKDYVEAMYLMLQQDVAEDFVIATGKTTTVRDFVKLAFQYLGVGVFFRGSGTEEKGIIDSIDMARLEELSLNIDWLKVWTEVVLVDPKYYRPTEVDELIGDSTLAQSKLNWTPKYDLNLLIQEMMNSDLKLARQDQFLVDNNLPYLNYKE